MKINTERTNEIRYSFEDDRIVAVMSFHDDYTCNLTIKPLDFSKKELVALLKELLKFKEVLTEFKD